MRVCDVLIIGGGPAGLSCGIHLARNNIQAVIVERNTFPFRKICGEVCSPKALQELEELGISLDGFRIVKDVEVLTEEHNLRFTLEKNGCMVIPRDELSKRMLGEALKGGVSVISGERVLSVKRENNLWVVGTDKNEYRSRILVGADGYASIVRREVFRFSPRSKDIAIGIRGIYREKNNGALQFYIFEETMPGYLWKFPIDDETVNVGFGVRGDVFKNKGINPLKTFDRLKEKTGFLSRLGEEVIPPQVHPIYLGSHICDTVGDNVILIGEAGGFVNPFTGEGIFYALRSGRICAEVISRHLSGRGHLFDFDVRWRKDFGFGLVLSKVYQRMATKGRIEKVLRFSYKYKDVRDTIFESLLGVPVLRISVYLKILFRR